MDALVAARIYQLFLIAKLTGVDLLRNPEAVSTVTSEKLIRTHRCLCQGVIDVARCRQSPSATNAASSLFVPEHCLHMVVLVA